MPFGLKNATQAFQQLMDQVGRGLPFVFIYLDDILVASGSQAEHVKHLRLLFVRHHQHGLVINPAKCQFGLRSISFLGHRVTPQGAEPLSAKVDAIRQFPRPLTVKGPTGVHRYGKCLPPIRAVGHCRHATPVPVPGGQVEESGVVRRGRRGIRGC